MQIIKAQRDAVLRPLQIVCGIVERRHTLPILSNVLVRKEGEHIAFLSSDIEMQITTHAKIGKGLEVEATTVSARKLLDILRALPDSEEIAISNSNKRLTVQNGKSRFALQTLAAEDFPTIKEESYNNEFSLPQKALKQLLDRVHFSMAHQDIRYYLNGMLLVTEGNHITGVATDGHRLAYTTQTVAESLNKQDVIIPRKTINELQRLLAETDDAVKIQIAPTQIKFSFSDIELISKLVEGKFPDYQRVIPKGYTHHLYINRTDLQQSLQRAAILANDKFKGVRCVAGNNTFRINSTNSDQEEAQEEMECEYAGAEVDIGFNVSYLQDVLSNLKTEKVQISFGDSNSSALFSMPEREDFKYVVMPMRI